MSDGMLRADGPVIYRTPGPLCVASTGALIPLPMAVHLDTGLGAAWTVFPDGSDAILDDFWRSYDHHMAEVAPDLNVTSPTGERKSRALLDAETLLARLSLPAGSRVLGYGAGRGDVFRHLKHRRPDLDIVCQTTGQAFRPRLLSFLSEDRVHIGAPPAAWRESFDVAVCLYDLAHTAEPLPFLRAMSACVKPGGDVVVSTADPSNNPGDLLVANHIGHFSQPALAALLGGAGVGDLVFDGTVFVGRWMAWGKRGGSSIAPLRPVAGAAAEAARLARLGEGWRDYQAALAAFLASLGDEAIVMLYGAGFYGALTLSFMPRLGPRPCAILDGNSELWGKDVYGLPVHEPAFGAGADALLVGLNPRVAKRVVAQYPELSRPDLRLFLPPEPVSESA